MRGPEGISPFGFLGKEEKMATPNGEGQPLTNEQEADAMINAVESVMPDIDIKSRAEEKAKETAKNMASSAKQNAKAAKDFMQNNIAEGKGALDGAGKALSDKAKGKANEVKSKAKDTVANTKKLANNIKNGDNPIGAANALMHGDAATAKARGKAAAVAAGKGAKNYAITKGMKGLNSAANASYKQGDGTTAGDAIAGVQNVGIAAMKFAANGIKALMGDPVAIAKFTAMCVSLALAVIVFIAVVVGTLMANIISAAWNKLTESFEALENELFGTAYDNFTMEDQYEILALAFSNEVLYAYESLLEDVENEIAAYQSDPTYNEWNQVMEYSKSIGKIDYTALNSVNDTFETTGLEQGMPPESIVYINGYTGDISDSEWGVNNVGSSVDTLSMTNPNYNKGMQKQDSTAYATGNEPYFDYNEVKESVKATLGYSAISDIAYLVSGYNVSMLEAPISKIGEKVSKLRAEVTVIAYKIDIATRVFQNTADYSGIFVAAINTIGDKLAKVFHGDTTYFAYDKDQITVNQTTQQRTVYEYTENIYYVQDEIFNYSVEYTCGGGCCGGSSDHEACSSCHGHSTSYGYAVPHQDYINACGATPPNITHDAYDDTAKSTWEAANPGYSVTSFSYSSSSNNGTAYPINRSTYNKTQKSYTKYTLDIPMEAFDVDRMMKALFETSPYFGDMTYYYTESMDGVKIDESQDEVIEKYGRYVGKWKYPYKPETVTYKEGTDEEFTVLYCKAGDDPKGLTGDEQKEFYDNGIDSQPYFEQQMVWLYDCDCEPHYGTHAECPNCGQKSISKAKDIPEKGFDSERPLSYLGIPIVYQDLYFSDASSEVGLETAMMEFKQDTSKVMTTTDKIILDDYTGEQIAGTYKVGDSEKIAVVLEDDEGGIHFPITVLDRVLSNKDTILNVLENSQLLQTQLAKRGLTYDERLVGGVNAMVTSPLADYLMNIIIDSTSYSNVTVLGDKTYSCGIGGFQGDDLKELLDTAISENPDAYREMCESARITGIDFSSPNWNSTKHEKSSQYMGVIRQLLSLVKNKQDEMFKEKMTVVMEFYRNRGITERTTLALLTAIGMQFDDISKVGNGGSATGAFLEYVIMPAINCGDADALDVTYENLSKWLDSYSRFDSPKIRNLIEKVYNQLKTDIENDNIPWMNTGALTPENLVPLMDMTSYFMQPSIKGDAHFLYTYNTAYESQRMSPAVGAQVLESLYQTGQGYFKGDCSIFVASLYYLFGYTVPTSSRAWIGNSYGYRARTDWANIQPGDVIVYSGHVELFIGGDTGMRSIGFGGQGGPTVKNYNYRTPIAFYRIVE